MIIKGTTKSGFHFAVDEAAPQSWGFLEAAVKLQKGDLTGAVEMVDILFPGAEKKRFLAHISTIDPTVPTSLVTTECDAVINEMAALKKSSPSQD